MDIKILTKDSLYITINDTTYYIDDSTNEQIFEKWNVDKLKKEGVAI
jgi:hypothetical protein